QGFRSEEVALAGRLTNERPRVLLTRGLFYARNRDPGRQPGNIVLFLDFQLAGNSVLFLDFQRMCYKKVADSPDFLKRHLPRPRYRVRDLLAHVPPWA